jgi:hypothetical protein
MTDDQLDLLISTVGLDTVEALKIETMLSGKGIQDAEEESEDYWSTYYRRRYERE